MGAAFLWLILTALALFYLITRLANAGAPLPPALAGVLLLGGLIGIVFFRNWARRIVLVLGAVVVIYLLWRSTGGAFTAATVAALAMAMLALAVALHPALGYRWGESEGAALRFVAFVVLFGIPIALWQAGIPMPAWLAAGLLAGGALLILYRGNLARKIISVLGVIAGICTWWASAGGGAVAASIAVLALIMLALAVMFRPFLQGRY